MPPHHAFSSAAHRLLPIHALPQEIRALGCTVPIVAMTANASERDRVECIAAGMDGFLRWAWGVVC